MALLLASKCSKHVASVHYMCAKVRGGMIYYIYTVNNTRMLLALR